MVLRGKHWNQLEPVAKVDDARRVSAETRRAFEAEASARK
jgi:hypothetical protein